MFLVAKVITYTIIIIVAIIALIVLFYVFSYMINKNKINKMNQSIESILNQIVSKDKDNFSFKKTENKKGDVPTYDYTLETNKYRYFIKVVPNDNNQEICVNNSVKWQLRKSFNDESMRFVPDIEHLMRLDLPISENNKINKKLYIIYPNARSLLKYINECEMEFVHPNTDVYGTNIITYVNLKEHLELIDL